MKQSTWFKKIHVSDVIAQFWYSLGNYRYLDLIIVLGYESVLFIIHNLPYILGHSGWSLLKVQQVFTYLSYLGMPETPLKTGIVKGEKGPMGRGLTHDS